MPTTAPAEHWPTESTSIGPPSAWRLALSTVGCVLMYVGVLVLAGPSGQRPGLAVGLLGWWVIYLALTRWVVRSARSCRRPVLAIVISAAVVQLPGLLSPPMTSSDAYRYVWDGRVQLSGTSPYRYVPLDDKLAGLRDRVLFPGVTAQQPSGVTTQPIPSDRDTLLGRAADDPRTRINRPQVPTVYPPVAEAWFAAVAAVTPWSWGTLGVQVAAALAAVAVAGVLAAWRRRHGGRPEDGLWWAWCPTVVLEAGNGAHVDIVATPLIMGAVMVVTWRPGAWARGSAGVLLGLAASVKLTPLVVVPAVASWRSGLRVALPAPLAATATLVATYVPHLLVVGWLVVGYLPGYLVEEGGVNQAGLLAVVMSPQAWRQSAVVVVMVVAALWALVRAKDSPAVVALTLLGVLLLAATPTYPWYALPLVALAVLGGRREWLGVAVAGQVAYLGALSPPIPAMGYAVAGLLVLAAAVRRRESGWSPT